ncbi:MAG: hypothetical protein QOJ65_2172 [Fimbriimonadaceae bacterium]|jgi:thioredoxin-related protein|nr:hypothetical protein [Fimbriimonadaceae bacterium]
MKKLAGFALALAMVTAAAGQGAKTPLNTQPSSTESLIQRAQEKARAEKKNVLVLFVASWCKWCDRLQAFTMDAQVKPILEENFVVVRLTALEKGALRAKENPGSSDLIDNLGARDAGLPFLAVLDPDGKPVITSLRPVEGKNKPVNAGWPTSAEELSHFVRLIRKGAPRATPEQIQTIESYLVKTNATTRN